MTSRLQRIWYHPWTMRWGRLIILALSILPIFLIFMHTAARNDGAILIGISIALYIGVAASMMTTEKYTARSLGLFACILGSAIYFTFLYLVYAKGEMHNWMPNLTRAMFVIGAPMFAIATVVALIQRTHARRDDRQQAEQLAHMGHIDLRSKDERNAETP